MIKYFRYKIHPQNMEHSYFITGMIDPLVKIKESETERVFLQKNHIDWRAEKNTAEWHEIDNVKKLILRAYKKEWATLELSDSPF